MDLFSLTWIRSVFRIEIHFYASENRNDKRQKIKVSFKDKYSPFRGPIKKKKIIQVPLFSCCFKKIFSFEIVGARRPEAVVGSDVIAVDDEDEAGSSATGNGSVAANNERLPPLRELIW